MKKNVPVGPFRPTRPVHRKQILFKGGLSGHRPPHIGCGGRVCVCVWAGGSIAGEVDHDNHHGYPYKMKNMKKWGGGGGGAGGTNKNTTPL